MFCGCVNVLRRCPSYSCHKPIYVGEGGWMGSIGSWGWHGKQDGAEGRGYLGPEKEN